MIKPIVTIATMLAAFGVFTSISASAEAGYNLKFEPHAVFFSKETKQPKAIDPQVFVKDAQVKAGIGPQNIMHAAKFRPAFLSAAPSTPLFNAKGTPLGFTLGSWLGAKGRVSVKPASGGSAEITAEFTGLRPDGVYSLFENHFDQNPIGFTPLDGQGSKNSFTANAKGSAKVVIKAPKMPTRVNAILLVFHNDGQIYGTSRGKIGINAEHQLIAKVP